MSLFRQILSGWLGRGPNRIMPFAAFADYEECCLKHGVHASECRSQVIRVEPDCPAYFTAAPNLLPDQSQLTSRSSPEWGCVPLLAPGREKRLFLLANSAVMGCEGLVYSPRLRAAVAETAALWDAPATRNPLLQTFRFPPPVHIPGISLSLLARSSVNFYHFLVESLPRLHLVNTLRQHIDHFIVSGTTDSYHTSWLAQAGVPAAKIVWADPLSHFQCDQLLFTNDLLCDQQPTPWNVAALRSVLGATPSTSTPHRRLWISRRAALSRGIAWESEAVDDLPGFELIALEDLEPARQIALFSAARHIIAPHGAGLANLAFCQPGTRVVELFPNSSVFPLYSRMAQTVGARPAWAVVDFQDPAAWRQLRSPLRSFLS